MRKAAKGGRPIDVDSGYLQPILMKPFKKNIRNKIAEKYSKYYKIKRDYDSKNGWVHPFVREAYLKQIFSRIFL